MLTPATVDEAEAFSAVLAAAFADYARGLGRERPGPYDWVPARLERGEGLWLGEGRLGVVLLSQTDHIAKIDAIGVRPDAQSGGFGARAVAAIEAHLRDRGVRVLHLQTAQRYTRLVAFYSRLGFRVNAVGPLPEGADDIVRVFMVKRL